MPYILLRENLPGITGLLDCGNDTALPIGQLTQVLLQGKSTLTKGEGELIAVFQRNLSESSTATHTSAAGVFFFNRKTAYQVKYNRGSQPSENSFESLKESV